jgi:hypothetical protein
MFFRAAFWVVLAGLFCAAGHREIGSMGVEMCRYGNTFCDNPFLCSCRRWSCGRPGRYRRLHYPPTA